MNELTIINKPPAQFVYKVPLWTAAANNALFACTKTIPPQLS